jgi:hypothetical protein
VSLQSLGGSPQVITKTVTAKKAPKKKSSSHH